MCRLDWCGDRSRAVAAAIDHQRAHEADHYSAALGVADSADLHDAGAGPHACVGMNLARIEMLALFTALAKRVRRLTILEQEPLLNNVLRGFKALRVAVK
jgi:cytochrome P450